MKWFLVYAYYSGGFSVPMDDVDSCLRAREQIAYQAFAYCMSTDGTVTQGKDKR